MPCHVREHLLQHIGKIAVVPILRSGRPDVRHAAGDMHDDVAVAARSVGGRGHQQGLRNAFQLIQVPMPLCSSSMGEVGELRGQRFYRV